MKCFLRLIYVHAVMHCNSILSFACPTELRAYTIWISCDSSASVRYRKETQKVMYADVLRYGDLPRKKSLKCVFLLHYMIVFCALKSAVT